MTQLHAVQHHHISLHCRCGHGALISVKSLLETLPPETAVHTVAAKARCRRCSMLGAEDFRLHYVCKTRDKKAALKFMKKAMRRYGSPNEIVTDKLGSYGAAARELGCSKKQVTK